MTIILTMTIVGLLGLALHLELYWVAATLVVFFVLLTWRARRAARKAAASPPE